MQVFNLVFDEGMHGQRALSINVNISHWVQIISHSKKDCEKLRFNYEQAHYKSKRRGQENAHEYHGCDTTDC